MKKLFILIFFLINAVNSGTRAQSVVDSSASARDNEISAVQIVDNYINAIGGKEKLMQVNDRTTVMKGTASGREVKMTIYQKAPDRIREIINAGTFIQNIFYNGEKGYMEVSGKKFDITGIELQNLKYESSLHLLPRLDSLGIKLKYEGKEKVDGKETYKVIMIFPSGSEWIQYYDPDTWLKVKESKEVKTAQGTYTQDTYLSNYQEVSGIKYPFMVRQSLGKQKMNFRVTMISINDNLNDKLFEIDY